MYIMLYKFLDKFKFLCKKQFGFRTFHSTNHVFVNITGEIRQGLNKDKFASGISLIFKRHFDTINHNILIAKRNHYGIKGITLD